MWDIGAAGEGGCGQQGGGGEGGSWLVSDQIKSTGAGLQLRQHEVRQDLVPARRGVEGVGPEVGLVRACHLQRGHGAERGAADGAGGSTSFSPSTSSPCQ